ncbi:MAG: metalloregulator ArsR/SmtB family transcription factor [Acidimicrobiales bacterium]
MSITLSAFDILVEPSRREILELLRDGELPVGDIVDHLKLSQPAVSKHLRVMKEAGFVHVRPEAQQRFYRICPEPLEQLDEWLEPYRKFWTTHLDRLESHLDQRRKQ